MGNEELLTLHGMATAIKSGELTFEEALKPAEEKAAVAGGKVGSSSVNDKLNGKSKDKPADTGTKSTTSETRNPEGTN